jgi:DNA-binding transcriptional MerR regulator
MSFLELDLMPPKTIETFELPDKLYFKIGEVSELVGVPAYVLRFWETEFKRINPKRTDSGQRLYRKTDVELIIKIKSLLYDQKYTITGAKRCLWANNDKIKPPINPLTLDDIRVELQQIRDML